MSDEKSNGMARRRGREEIDESVSPEEHAEATASQWHATLTAAWSKPHLTLASAVHWIATEGIKREADIDELERAAKQLLDDLREGKIVASAISPASGTRQIVPAIEFADDQPFYGDESISDRAAPTLRWNTEVEHDRSDDFEERSGQTVWRDLRVDRAKFQKSWPAAQGAPADKRRAGRPGGKRDRVAEAMLRDMNAGYDLQIATEEELVAKYKHLGKPSRGTCVAARKIALSKMRPTISDH